MLFKNQTNELFKLIADKGIDIGSITIEEENGAFKIYYEDVNKLPTSSRTYSFQIDPSKYDYTVYYNPGRFLDEHYTRDRNIKWKNVIRNFGWWLNRIEQETPVLDLWAEAAKTAQLFAPISTPTDDKFTRTELAEVQGQLRLLQRSFTTAALPEAARQKLIELTQTAAVKAEGLTKKDWQNWLIGGFISAIASCALNPTQAGEVLKLVKAAFGGLFLH